MLGLLSGRQLIGQSENSSFAANAHTDIAPLFADDLYRNMVVGVCELSAVTCVVLELHGPLSQMLFVPSF